MSHSLTHTAVWLTLAAGIALAARQGDPKPPQKLLASDRPVTEEVVVTDAKQTYDIEFKGTVDGVMTRMPISYAAYHQGFQPNVFCRLENIGETDIHNPWITVNGQRRWRTVAEIAEQATIGCETEAEKARAVWEFTRHHRFHACTWDGECNDAVKVFNVYGYTLCGNDAQVISDIWKAAGLETRRGYPIGHCVAEAFFDGAFHLLDGDEHVICLKRDNKTIASCAEIVRDHDLVKRTHTYSIGAGHSRRTDEFSASLYWYEGERTGSHGGHTKHTMQYRLRPGESIEWRWDHIGKQYSAGVEPPDGRHRKDGDNELRGGWGDVAYWKMCNAKLSYLPDLRSDPGRRFETAEDLAPPAADDAPALHPVEAGKSAVAVWEIAPPYVVVGGKAVLRCRRASAADQLALSLSRDGKEWESIWTADETGAFDQTIVFDEKLSPRAKPQYAYFLRLEMKSAAEPGAVGLDALRVDTDVQTALLCLPELQVGANTVEFADETNGPRRAKITHSWVERTEWHRPAAPAKPVFPADGATVEGTQIDFKWEPATDPDGDEIADYHFELSDRADMRWTLSPNFERLSSKTPSKGKPEWTVPYVGLLNPDTDYYWRVRAKDKNGVWGEWSDIWRFRCDAPGVPLEVSAEEDGATGRIVLSWQPNPEGRTPVRYKVYGSDEQGFTASDTEYTVFMGKGFCDSMEEFEKKADDDSYSGQVKTPANLVGEAAETRLAVAGPGADLPNANKAFYRVVAVDERGVESGPSDYAALPRPWIYTRAPAEAKVGQPYEYQAGAIRSIGHLTCFKGYNAAFWNREKLEFKLADAPAWLKVEPATGKLTGTPAKAGEHAVTLVVANSKEGRAEQKLTLRVVE